MKKINLYTLITLFSALLLSGCCSNNQQVIEDVCFQNMDKQLVFDSAVNTLQKMHFEIEKADPNAGFIQTRPLPAAQYFEFWRSDNVGCFNTKEANLHSLRRTAQLQLSHTGNQIRLSSQVLTQRLDMPEKTKEGKEAYNYFAHTGQDLIQLELSDVERANLTWIDLGNDELLASKILTQIEKQISKGAK